MDYQVGLHHIIFVNLSSRNLFLLRSPKLGPPSVSNEGSSIRRSLPLRTVRSTKKGPFVLFFIFFKKKRGFWLFAKPTYSTEFL